MPLRKEKEDIDMDILRAKELLISLADGVNPYTGEILPNDCICNQAEIVRAFHCILNSLKEKPRKKLPENAGKPWSTEEEEALSRMFDAGSTRKDMRMYFKRTDGALAARLVQLGKIQSREEFAIRVK